MYDDGGNFIILNLQYTDMYNRVVSCTLYWVRIIYFINKLTAALCCCFFCVCYIFYNNTCTYFKREFKKDYYVCVPPYI